MNNTTEASENKKANRIVPAKFLLPFILVTSLFALWGFANDITNPMVAAFKKILLISNFESSLVQFAFYGGYCLMAVPAALFIKRFSYKSGILVGLTLYSAGALFFPVAGHMMDFWAFLLAYFVLTCGLSFLETTSNPYILSMGPEETSTQRLNFAQSFNPMGSLVGMTVAMLFILNALTNVNTDPEIAPVLANEAQVRVEKITTAPDLTSLSAINTNIDISNITGLDKAKWMVLNKSHLSSWLSSDTSDKISKSIETGTPVDWDAVRAQLKSTQANLAGILPIIATKDDNATKLQKIQDAGLTATISSDELEAIKTRIDTKKKIRWTETPLLKGTPNEESARRLIAKVDKDQWKKIQQFDLKVLQGPYFTIGIVVFVALILFLIIKLPKAQHEDNHTLNVGPTLKRLGKNPKYIEGVIAQAFYVGAQIMCWTFVIQYATNELGMTQGDAQKYNIMAMITFCLSRFICTFLLKFVSPGGLLGSLAIGGASLITGTIFIKGMPGLYCLLATSACMSLMFPTIYGIALKGLGEDAKLGAAGLIMAIGGGCFMPPMQGWIMDQGPINLGFTVLSSTRASFVLPLICFVVIILYGFRTHLIHHKN